MAASGTCCLNPLNVDFFFGPRRIAFTSEQHPARRRVFRSYGHLPRVLWGPQRRWPYRFTPWSEPLGRLAGAAPVGGVRV